MQGYKQGNWYYEKRKIKQIEPRLMAVMGKNIPYPMMQRHAEQNNKGREQRYSVI